MALRWAILKTWVDDWPQPLARPLIPGRGLMRR
jgi:hypothetical protein